MFVTKVRAFFFIIRFVHNTNDNKDPNPMNFNQQPTNKKNLSEAQLKSKHCIKQGQPMSVRYSNLSLNYQAAPHLKLQDAILNVLHVYNYSPLSKSLIL